MTDETAQDTTNQAKKQKVLTSQDTYLGRLLQSVNPDKAEFTIMWNSQGEDDNGSCYLFLGFPDKATTMLAAGWFNDYHEEHGDVKLSSLVQYLVDIVIECKEHGNDFDPINTEHMMHEHTLPWSSLPCPVHGYEISMFDTKSDYGGVYFDHAPVLRMFTMTNYE